MSAKMTSKGKVGIKNKYYTQLLGIRVVKGEMIPNNAIPVGIKRTKGAHVAASFGSLNMFWRVIERLRKEIARSQRARKSWINMPIVRNVLFRR